LTDCCEGRPGIWRSTMGCCEHDTALFVCHKRQEICCKYWASVNFSRKALLFKFVSYLPHIIFVEMKIFVPLTPWRHEKMFVFNYTPRPLYFRREIPWPKGCLDTLQLNETLWSCRASSVGSFSP
jgi:hypothetical protein